MCAVVGRDPRATLVAAVYVRISKDRTGKMVGVSRQQPPCIDLVKRLGWQLGGVYVDNDISAYKRKRRPDYQRLCADLRAGTVRAVVVWRDDRLHRQPRELEDFIDLVEATGAEVRTVMSGDHDLTTADGRFRARIGCAFARHESEVKGERLRLMHTELAEKGMPSGGGNRAFGFEPGRRILRESEAAEIREATRRLSAGDSLLSVVKDWNERGVATPTGRQWATSTVRQMLRSAHLSGQREHDGRIVGPAQWPAIISPEDTARLRVLLSRPSTAKDRARKHLLSGFLVCGVCVHQMVARPARRWPRYACTKDRGGCGGVSVSGAAVDELISEAVWAMYESPRFAEFMADQPVDSSDTDALADVARLEADIEDLARMHGTGTISVSEWMAAREPKQQQLADARERVARSRPVQVFEGIPAGPGALEAAWPNLGLGRKRSIIGTVIESVKVAPAAPDAAGRRFDRGRVLGPGPDRGIAWRL